MKVNCTIGSMDVVLDSLIRLRKSYCKLFDHSSPVSFEEVFIELWRLQNKLQDLEEFRIPD